MHYVYLLALANQQIYTGRSDDLKRRIAEHERGKVDSTKNHRPLTLIGYEAYALKSDAIRREEYLKTTDGKRLVKQQYRDILKTFQG